MVVISTESNPRPTALSAEERHDVRRQVVDACQPVAQSWPLRTFAYRSPVRGYEHLPFDDAVREAKQMLGGVGYLANDEYRQFYRDGRITDENVERAMRRRGPSVDPEAAVEAGSRRIEASEVFLLHLLTGIEALEPNLLEWTLEEECLANPLKGHPPTGDLWGAILSLVEYGEPISDEPDATPSNRTLADWLDSHTETSIVEQINGQMIKWTAAFLDEGVAGWGMPARSQGFYSTWRELAVRDASGHLLGVRDFGAKIGALPDSPEEAVMYSLNRLDVPAECWKEYQSRHFAQLPGWTGFIRWRSENPEYPAQHEYPIDLVEYLAVRLFYELELVSAFCSREWGVAGTLPAISARISVPESRQQDTRVLALCRSGWRLFQLAWRLRLTPEEVAKLSQTDSQTLLRWLDAFPAEDHGRVWLEAYEDAYREGLVERLSKHSAGAHAEDERPKAQLIFCIDARSEPFRRHIESRGPYDTYGYAGFFGVPISHQALDSTERLALCPVLLKPGYAVAEIPCPGEEGPLRIYASGTRWRRLGDELFHDLKQNPISSFMLVDALGLLFSIGLIGKTLVRKPFVSVRGWLRRHFKRSIRTYIPFSRIESDSSEPGLLQGFTLEEQTAFVQNGLRIIGLTERLGRFVVVCGHGAISENNPYAAAYNCGACGGAHGDPNARVFADMANRPEIRKKLADNGLVVPEDTWFLAGKHDTTSDRVAFYDVAEVPPSHAEDLRLLAHDLEEAGAAQALERLGRLPGSPSGMSPRAAHAHALSRSADWANVRPEWGLSSNAAFIIGRRRMTVGLDLDSRAFLHSYDPDSDPDGALLEKIMTAPLIVGEWINMEYYFSAVDPWFYGSGSKVIHNVVSGVGVMLGSQSDLQSGLPLQGVNDGATHYHEPMRLLAIIEAPMQRIAAAIDRHAILQQVFHNEWINLLACDPETRQFHRYSSDSRWEAMPLPRAA